MKPTVLILLFSLPATLPAIRLGVFGDISQADVPGSGVYTRVCPTNKSLSDACHVNTGLFSLLTSNDPWDSVHAISTTSGGWFAEAATSTNGLRARSGAGFLNYGGGDFTPVSPHNDPPVGYAAASLAWVTEDITIRGPAGEHGQFVPSFRLTGFLASTHNPATDGGSFLLMGGCANVYATQAGFSSPIASGGHCAVAPVDVIVNHHEVMQPPNSLTQQFAFNVPIRLSIAMDTSIHVSDANVAPNLRSDTAVSNFYSTLTLDPILILDLNGNPVPDLILESASGVFTLDARNQTNDVPEPGTLPILALLTAAAALRRMILQTCSQKCNSFLHQWKRRPPVEPISISLLSRSFPEGLIDGTHLLRSLMVSSRGRGRCLSHVGTEGLVQFHSLHAVTLCPSPAIVGMRRWTNTLIRWMAVAALATALPAATTTPALETGEVFDGRAGVRDGVGDELFYCCASFFNFDTWAGQAMAYFDISAIGGPTFSSVVFEWDVDQTQGGGAPATTHVYAMVGDGSLSLDDFNKGIFVGTVNTAGFNSNSVLTLDLTSFFNAGVASSLIGFRLVSGAPDQPDTTAPFMTMENSFSIFSPNARLLSEVGDPPTGDVPEPATCTSAIFGGAALWIARRSRKGQAK